MKQQHNKHEKFMTFLKNVAINHDSKHRCKVSALLVYKNYPIAVGTNKMKSHPFQAKYGRTEHNIFSHAEMDCIRKALKDISMDELAKSTLYIQRVLKDGTTAIARPCCGCERAIVKSFKIKNVIWSTDTGYSGTFEEKLDGTTTDSIYQDRRIANKKENKSIQLPARRHHKAS